MRRTSVGGGQMTDEVSGRRKPWLWPARIGAGVVVMLAATAVVLTAWFFLRLASHEPVPAIAYLGREQMLRELGCPSLEIRDSLSAVALPGVFYSSTQLFVTGDAERLAYIRRRCSIVDWVSDTEEAAIGGRARRRTVRVKETSPGRYLIAVMATTSGR